MAKTRLELNVLYELSMLDRVQYGPVSKQRLYERFTDGRISGLLNEDLLASLFSGFTRSDKSGGSYDLLDSDDRKYEARTITKSPLNLRPSNQKGQGRIQDDEAAMARRAHLYAYIFVDVRDSPRYRIFAMRQEELPDKFLLSQREIDEVIGGLTKTVSM